MTDQQMPARIWVRVCGGGVSLPGGRAYQSVAGGSREAAHHVAYVRSDIAARMAEAILASIDMIDGCHDAPKNPDSLPEMVKVHLQQALSAFRSATQDTDARHD